MSRSSNEKRTVPRCAAHTHTPVSINCYILCTAFDLYIIRSFRLEHRVSSSLLLMSFVFSVQSTNLKISALAGSKRLNIYMHKSKSAMEWFCVFGVEARAHKFLDTENQSNEIILFPWEIRIANENNTIRTRQAAVMQCIQHNDNSDFENCI